MRVEGVYIDALGVVLPEWVSTEQAAADGIVKAEVFEESGLTGTHIAGDVPALDMAVTAARTALDRSSLDTESIGSHIHCATHFQGPDGSYPPGYIHRELDLSDAPALYLRQGCSGMFAALDVAVGHLTGAAQVEAALLTTGENFTSQAINRWTDYSPSFILADGAASVLLSAESGFAEIRSLNSGVLHELEKWQRGEGTLVLGLGETYSLAERLAQFTENDMSIADILNKVATFGVDIMHRSLVDADLNASDIAMVIPVNMDGRMIEWSVMSQLGLPMERSSWEYGRAVGHVGAADVMISLEHLLRTGALSPGDHVLLTAQSPGWLCSSCVITIRDIPTWAA